MQDQSTIEERCRKILEDNGGVIADKARTILLEDSALKDLRAPLEFVSKNWRNPLTPAMIRLSCEAVRGRPEETYEAALAMSLMSLSFYIWDDIIDKAPTKLFRPTLFGKFGEGTALIIGGLASARAFSIVNEMDMDKEKHQTVTKLFWNLWVKMAEAETVNLRLRNQANFSSRKKLWKIRKEVAADLETCLRIGALIGNGSEGEVRHLERYGLCLGMILEIWKDFCVSINLTLELAEKIRNGILPYSLLWAMERSEKIRKKLDRLTNENAVEPSNIKEIVENTLEIGTLDNTARIIRRFTQKAKETLSEMTKNTAIQTLQIFIEAQSRLFTESLLKTQAHRS
jgi:geranylgeranyl diphosphate synthase type I